MNLPPLEDLILPAMLLVIAVFVWHAWNIKQDSPSWPSVEGVIEVSRAMPMNENGNEQGHLAHQWRTEIRYRYVVDGVVYNGNRLKAFQANHFDQASADTELAPYPVGSKVRVYFQPDSPSTSVLIPG